MQLVTTQWSESRTWFIQNKLELALSHDSKGKDGNHK